MIKKTVLASITKGFEVTRASNLDIIVLTCDQAIYQIGVNITVNQPVVAIIGDMHFLVDFNWHTQGESFNLIWIA